MANSYAEMITQICIDVIPGYEPYSRIEVKGKYKYEDGPRAEETPVILVNLKINFGGDNGTSNA